MSMLRQKFANPRERLRLAAGLILIVAVLAAVIVYIAAADDADSDALGYQIVGGQAYASGAGGSSRELQQLERLGGKAAVQTFKLQRWVDSLWHGQRLAYTLLLLGAGAAALCWYVAGLLDEPGRS
jgi:hypothetical protein